MWSCLCYGILTPDEHLRLETWADIDPDNRDFSNTVLKDNLIWEDALKWMELGKLDQESWEVQLERKTLSKVAATVPNKSQRFSPILTLELPYAAAILLFATVGIPYYAQRDLLETPEISRFDYSPVHIDQ